MVLLLLLIGNLVMALGIFFDSGMGSSATAGILGFDLAFGGGAD